jgi:hypothetical protein
MPLRAQGGIWLWPLLRLFVALTPVAPVAAKRRTSTTPRSGTACPPPAVPPRINEGGQALLLRAHWPHAGPAAAVPSCGLFYLKRIRFSESGPTSDWVKNARATADVPAK